MAGDEDHVPGNGNPHPEHPNPNSGVLNKALGWFEVVQDLDEVHQENINLGWKQPPPALLGNEGAWGL
jgi:hypothetical protein